MTSARRRRTAGRPAPSRARDHVLFVFLRAPFCKKQRFQNRNRTTSYKRAFFRPSSHTDHVFAHSACATFARAQHLPVGTAFAVGVNTGLVDTAPTTFAAGAHLGQTHNICPSAQPAVRRGGGGRHEGAQTGAAEGAKRRAQRAKTPAKSASPSCSWSVATASWNHLNKKRFTSKEGFSRRPGSPG